MIVYGTQINSDIDFSLDLPRNLPSRYKINFSSQVPKDLINSITCGFPFYQAHGRKVYLYSDQIFDRSKVGQPWCYEVKDVVRFYWRGGDTNIYYIIDEKGNVELLSFWFLHLLLPLFFTLENMYDFLHGGAVEVCDKSIILTAPSMGGKSTLTEYFLKRGHKLISDDKIPTFINGDELLITGSHPHYRPYRKFEDLGFHTDNFMTYNTPVDSLYYLKKSEKDSPVNIHKITGFQKFDTIFPNYLYMFNFLKSHRLNYLSQLLNQLQVFEISIPWKLHRIPEVYNKIRNHLV